MTKLKWLNKEKDRFYTMTLRKHEQETMVNYAWGACHSNRGGQKSILVRDDEEVVKHINYMLKRRKTRGYELIPTLH